MLWFDKNKYLNKIIEIFILIIGLTSCTDELTRNHDYNSDDLPIEIIDEKEINNMFYITVNERILEVKTESNTSVDALIDVLSEGDLIIEMEDYGNFEKVGPLGVTLPTNDTNYTTEPGDIILYQGDKITIYYDSTTWNFTIIGKIQNITQSELMKILGDGDVLVKLSLKK